MIPQKPHPVRPGACPEHEQMMKTAMERESERLEWTRRIALSLLALPTMDAAAVLMVTLPPEYLRAIENAIGAGINAAGPGHSIQRGTR